MDLKPPTNGVATSNAAADSVEESAATLRMQVYEAIKDAGSNGMTDDELMVKLDMRGNTLHPRRWELTRKFKNVVDSGKRRRTRTGRNAIVWVVVNPNDDAEAEYL